MVFESNEIRVTDGEGPAFEAAFTRARQLLLRIPGCRSAELLRRIGEPGRYQVRIGWERLEDHVEIYPGTAEAAEIRALLAPLIAGIDRSHCEPVPF
jgi:heme-degrading monooxygenase HmoA